LTEYTRILNDFHNLLHGGYRHHQGEEIGEYKAQQDNADPMSALKDELSNNTNRVVSHERSSPSSHDLDTLPRISNEIAGCHQCNLYLTRDQTVPGVGVQRATLMVVTDSPVDSARAESSPLAQYEQEYLDKWLSALELDIHNDVFITPAVKCRTPGARPPHQAELVSCSFYLRRQFKSVRPQAILALGATATAALTGNSADFPSLVGQDWTWGSIPALVLWSPAEVLAHPGRLRAPVWKALQRLKKAWDAIPGNRL